MNNRLVEVEKILDTIRPAMQADGGDVKLIAIDGGVIRVRQCGACIACPSKNLTLKLGIERTLKSQLPWVVEVVRVEEHMITAESITHDIAN